jgi:hypothetical protein
VVDVSYEHPPYFLIFPEATLRIGRVLLAALAIFATTETASAQEPVKTTGFHGFLFGDVVYVARERASSDGFLVGQLVGHGNAHMSERVSFFGEASATARPDGYAFEIERAILRYDFADALKLSVGRYHTPISYWNTAYHHGLWLQTSVARPEIIKVGGRFMPVHFIGLLAEGMLNTGVTSFSYEVGVGNGRGSNLARGGDAGDVNRSRATLAAARLRPFDYGLQLGGSIYMDRVPAATTSLDERITSAHLVWDRGAPELIAEYAWVRHEPDAGSAFMSEGWYAHAGYRLGGPFYRFKPYLRAERLDANAADPVFTGVVEDYRASVAGLRYDFDAFASIKGEYRRERFGASAAVNGLYLQVAFAIASGGVM